MVSQNIKIGFGFVIVAVTFAVALVFLQPSPAYALGLEADAMCNPVDVRCPCGSVMTNKGCVFKGPQANKHQCPPGICFDVTNNITTKGTCIAPNNCEGVSFGEGAGQKGGGVDTGLKALQSILGAVKSLLGGGGGGGGGAPPPPPSSGLPPEQPNVVDQIRPPQTSDSLVDDLNKDENSGIGSILNNAFGFGSDDEKEGDVSEDGDTTIDEIAGGGAGAAPTQGDGEVPRDGASTPSGDDAGAVSSERGEIREGGDGATLEAGVRDPSGNSEIAGFYGVSGGVPKQGGVIGRLCTARPWANSFVSNVIPDTFFDGLCVRRGYAVGAQNVPAQGAPNVQTPTDITRAEQEVKEKIEEFENKIDNTNDEGKGIICEPAIARPNTNVALNFSCGSAALAATVGFTVERADQTSATVGITGTTQYGIICDDDFTATCTVQVVDPRVSIWAEPEDVRLGSRTTVFWQTQDVEQCEVSGPSFSERGASGGASTVPINSESTFTVSCVAPDGKEVSESVTVGFSQ